MTFGATTIEIHHTGHAHTDSDIMVEVPERGVVFAGDVIEYGRAVSSDAPSDFSVTGQFAATEYLLDLGASIFVPGHGPTGGPEIAEAARNFLRTLQVSVSRHYDDGLRDYEMKDLVAADMADYADWVNFDELGRLVSHVYLQVEQEKWE